MISNRWFVGHKIPCLLPLSVRWIPHSRKQKVIRRSGWKKGERKSKMKTKEEFRALRYKILEYINRCRKQVEAQFLVAKQKFTFASYAFYVVLVVLVWVPHIFFTFVTIPSSKVLLFTPWKQKCTTFFTFGTILVLKVLFFLHVEVNVHFVNTCTFNIFLKNKIKARLS